MIQIENNDKNAGSAAPDGMGGHVVYHSGRSGPLSPFIAIDRMNSAAAFLNTFLVAQTGIVVGFMGATAWSKSKENK
jgi:hypothetical protein